MRERTLAIEMIPGSCAAACHSCPVGRDKPIKPGELEKMSALAFAIRERVDNKLNTVVSLNTPHNRIESIASLHPLLAKTDSLMLTFGRGLNDGIEQHGKGDIEAAAHDFIRRIQRDLESAPALPDRLTICIHLSPEESFDDLIQLEALMTKMLLESGLIGKTERGIKKINFRVTKNDIKKEEVNTRGMEISEKFLDWKKTFQTKKMQIGPLFDTIGKAIFMTDCHFGLGPMRVGVNNLLIGERVFDNRALYLINRGDSLTIFRGKQRVCDLEWDYRLLHHKGRFGKSGNTQEMLRERMLYDFTLLPDEVHFGHSAINMLMPELRFRHDEFQTLLREGNIVARTKRAIRQRIKAISS